MGVVALGSGVYRIPTAGDFINSFAFVEADGSVTLVDTGTSFASKRIVNGLAQFGKHPHDVQRIVLTHAHSDHVGSAARLLPDTGADGAEVHADDADFVRQGRSAPSATALASMFTRLPGMGFRPCPVTATLTDGQVLDVAGGIVVHHTPGHTPGHVSLLHPDSGVLITGDSIFNMSGRMTWPFKAFCTDFPLNRRTSAVLADLDYTTAAFTHGPQIDTSAREAVRGFLRRKGVVQ
jgi:glyoxylase-like metal-dependent hydrolase (beta-lactamase superfamily II)